MRQVGKQTIYDYEDFSGDDKVLSPDGAKAAAFWCSSSTSDLFGEDETYRVKVWKVPTGELIVSLVRGHEIRAIAFRGADELEIRYASGVTEVVPAAPEVGLDELDPDHPRYRRPQG